MSSIVVSLPLDDVIPIDGKVLDFVVSVLVGFGLDIAWLDDADDGCSYFCLAFALLYY